MNDTTTVEQGYASAKERSACASVDGDRALEVLRRRPRLVVCQEFAEQSRGALTQSRRYLAIH